MTEFTSYQPPDTASEQGAAEHLTAEQDTSLRAICQAFHVEYNPDHYHAIFDLPPDWVAGWVGGRAQQFERRTIYIGCSPEGEVHS